MHFKKLFSVLYISLCLCVLCGCGNSTKKNTIQLSSKAMMAKWYIDNEFPDDFKREFYSGMWGNNANILTLLVDSGHLEGAVEYSEALSSQR